METKTTTVDWLFKLVPPQRGAADSSDHPVGSPECKCFVCLGNITKSGSPNCCRHKFCFDCLAEWAKIKKECPLCKGTFTSIIHFSANGKRLRRFLHGSSTDASSSFQPVNRITEYRFRVNLLEFLRHARQRDSSFTTPPPFEASACPVAQRVGAAEHNADDSSDDEYVPASNNSDRQETVLPRERRELASFHLPLRLSAQQGCPAMQVTNRQSDVTGSTTQEAQKREVMSLSSSSKPDRRYLNGQERNQFKNKAPVDKQVRPASAASASKRASAAADGHFTEITGAPATTESATFSNSMTPDDDSASTSDGDLPIVTDVFAYMESLQARRSRRRAERDLARSAAGPSESTALHAICQADIAAFQIQPKQERVDMSLLPLSQQHPPALPFHELTQPQQEVPDVTHSMPAGALGRAAAADSAVKAATASTAAVSNAVPSEADAESTSDVMIVSEQKPWGERTPVVLSSDNEDGYDRAGGRSRSRSPLRAAADTIKADSSNSAAIHADAKHSGGSGQRSPHAFSPPSNPDQTGMDLTRKSRRRHRAPTEGTKRRSIRISKKCQIGLSPSRASATGASAKCHLQAKRNQGSPPKVVCSGEVNNHLQFEELTRSGDRGSRRLRSRSPLGRTTHGAGGMPADISCTKSLKSNSAMMADKPTSTKSGTASCVTAHGRTAAAQRGHRK